MQEKEEKDRVAAQHRERATLKAAIAKTRQSPQPKLERKLVSALCPCAMLNLISLAKQDAEKDVIVPEEGQMPINGTHYAPFVRRVEETSPFRQRALADAVYGGVSCEPDGKTRWWCRTITKLKEWQPRTLEKTASEEEKLQAIADAWRALREHFVGLEDSQSAIRAHEGIGTD
jgi:hypothetical protein